MLKHEKPVTSMKHSVLGWETMSKIRTQKKQQTPYYPFVGASY